MGTVRAVILAAGEGRRLRPYTLDKPKGMVELAGRPLLAHQIHTMRSLGLENIVVVGGYKAECLGALGVPVVMNQQYAATNMVASLMCVKNLLDGACDVVVSYGDIVYQENVLRDLLACNASLATTVDLCWERLWRLRHGENITDVETMKVSPQGFIQELGRIPHGPEDIHGQYIGLIKIRADLAPLWVKMYKELDDDDLVDGRSREQMFMTGFLQYQITHGVPLKAVFVKGGWLEVDSVKDLNTYNHLVKQGKLDDYCRLS